MKEDIMKDIEDSDSLLPLGNYYTEQCTQINSLKDKNPFQLHGTNPQCATLGEEGDISNLCVFGWFEWC